MMNPRMAVRFGAAAVAGCILPMNNAAAMPAFARQYNLSCSACHVAYPRLSQFGEQFRDMNYRLPNWRDQTIDMGDPELALPKLPPVAFRAQAYVQGRDGEETDPATGPTGNRSGFDFQTPYLIKLLSSAPLSEHITYYFYGIFAEKGVNGETAIEDAWFRHDDLFGTQIGLQLGQFQVSDLMFPRELRMSFQDFMAYRTAGITYERGVIFDRKFGSVTTALGFVNGNGINANFDINSPGFRRPDKLFDNDSRKTGFGRIGLEIGPVNAGIFGLAGKQASATGTAGSAAGVRQTAKRVAGLDLSGDIAGKFFWFAQGLWNNWSDFLDADPARDYKWFGGFAGMDYVATERWAYSLLYNYAEADDFKATGTIYEGIKMNTLTLGASYYFMRNVKGVIEMNFDFLKKDPPGPPFVGHQSKENYILIGIDAAF
ncbi:MAG: hypothetical protein ACKVQA_11490 [Burkholderiales bacterium]